MKTSKRHFEINWPLIIDQKLWNFAALKDALGNLDAGGGLSLNMGGVIGEIFGAMKVGTPIFYNNNFVFPFTVDLKDFSIG